MHRNLSRLPIKMAKLVLALALVALFCAVASVQSEQFNEEVDVERKHSSRSPRPTHAPDSSEEVDRMHAHAGTKTTTTKAPKTTTTKVPKTTTTKAPKTTTTKAPKTTTTKAPKTTKKPNAGTKTTTTKAPKTTTTKAPKTTTTKAPKTTTTKAPKTTKKP